jgi:hypothetical protein
MGKDVEKIKKRDWMRARVLTKGEGEEDDD